MTSKTAHHIELRENSVREWVQDKSRRIKHDIILSSLYYDT